MLREIMSCGRAEIVLLTQSHFKAKKRTETSLNIYSYNKRVIALILLNIVPSWDIY